MQVTVKTLDSQNHSFSVPEESTVKDFKAQIAPVLGIDAEKQRLIFCGRVLQDDKKLTEYDVDGKVIHLVQRPPPQSQSAHGNSSSSATSNATGGSLPTGTTRQATLRDGSSFLLGAFSIPQDVIDPAHVQNIVQDVVSGMGEWGRNATVMSQTSDDGSSVNVHIDLGHVPLQSEAQLRINQIRTMLNHANNIIQSLDNAASGRNGNSSEADQSRAANVDSERNGARLDGQDMADDMNSHPENVLHIGQHVSSTPHDIPMFSQFSDTSTSNNSSVPATASASSTTRDSTSRAVPFSFSPLTAIPISQSTSSNANSTFGEGLAQAARAAVAAAVAAASTAAARAGAPSSVSVRHSVAVRAVDRDRDSGGTNQAQRRSSSEVQTANTSVPSEQNSGPESESSTDANRQAQVSVESSSSDPIPSASSTTASSTTSSTTTTTTSSTGNTRREVTHPRIEVIANLWEEVNALNNRFAPHLQRCMEIIRSDATLTSAETRQAQNMYNWISKIMHFLSHIYHSLSDMYVNFNQSAPRTLRVRIVSSSSSPAFFHSRAVPVHAQINISTPSTSSADPTVTTASTARPTAASNPLINAFTNMTELQADTVTSTEGERPLPSAPPADASVGPQRPTATSSAGSTGTSSSAQTEPSFVPLFGQSSPFVFMEVGPGRFQLDRQTIPLLDNPVEENVQSTAEPTTTSTTTTGESDRAQTPSQSESQQPTTARNINTHAYPTTPFSSSSGRGLSSMPLHTFAPVGLPLPFGGFDSFDPNLPCNSIWAMDTSLRRRHNAGTSSSSSSSSQATRMNLGVTPNAQGRQEDQFHNIISGLVSSLFNQPMQGSSASSTANHEVPGFTMFTTTTTINGRRRSQSAGPANRNSSTNSRDQATEPMDSTQSTQTETSQNAATPPETPFDLFSIFTEGSSNQVTAGIGDPRVTLADIIQNINESSLVEGESIIRDLFICLVREFNFSDLTALVCGCGEPLGRIRSLLQNFVRRRVLQNEEPTEENIDRAVERLITEGQEMMNLVTADVNVKPDIDYEATMKNFARHNLKKLIDKVLNGTGGNTFFGTQLYRECRRMITESVALHNHCFADGSVSLRRIVERLTQDLTSGIDIEILLGNMIDDVDSNLQNISVPFSILRKYIVHRMPSPESPNMTGEVQRMEASLSSAETGMSSSQPQSSDTKANSAENATENQPSADFSEVPLSSETCNVIEGGKRTAASAAGLSSTSLGSNLSTVNNISSDEQLSQQQLPDVIVGSESWHTSVPREWVPIIARDIHRQRRQAPQSMFSDAYLGGMPSKRRKVMTNGSATSNLLSSAQNTLSETLQQAIAAAGVRPRTSVEQVKREAAQDTSLQKAYKEQLKYSIQERLQNDMDYNPDRFPNSEKYFNGQ